MPENKKVSLSETISWKESVTIQVRTYLSIQHVQSAALLSRHSAQVEKANGENPGPNTITEHAAYVVGCILSSVAFLEAAVNEFFADAADHPNELKQTLDQDTIEMLAITWRSGLFSRAGLSVLEKFQFALQIGKKEGFDSGRLPYQDVSLLIRLRNSLVHYQPESVTVICQNDPEAVSIQNLERQLKGKFGLNPLVGCGGPFFPQKCLSHGCAEWAVRSSLALSDEFYSKLGLKPPYHHVKHTLVLE